jgi:hypothetical protein
VQTLHAEVRDLQPLHGSAGAARGPIHRLRLPGRLSIRNGGKRALGFPVESTDSYFNNCGRNILTSLKTCTDAAAEFGKDAKESVEELGRSAGRTIERARDEAADALHTAASSVRATGRQGSAAIDDVAAGTADRLDATASYVENHDLKDVFAGLRRFGRRHLTGSLMAAAAVGFFAGSALARVAHSWAKTPEKE